MFPYTIAQRETSALGSHSKRPNIVEICDKHYFDKLGIDYGSIKELILNIIKCHNLNNEQERAFRIIAQHSAGLVSEPLYMYIGGMGGTGKSQVIKAVLQFFADRNSSFAIATSAPTGNAAALLGGSTYHFLLGLNNKVEEVGRGTMAQVTLLNYHL
ncbi:hypothetical protein EV359DRAFT_68549 [Lentinula novae-zelandiae]|nr:hypothetical protein EV359DRAFT_68549 [Lentinula novae-zelandiae]